VPHLHGQASRLKSDLDDHLVEVGTEHWRFCFSLNWGTSVKSW
jgi:hypothetical protein